MRACFIGTTDGKGGWVMYHRWERRGKEIWMEAVNYDGWFKYEH